MMAHIMPATLAFLLAGMTASFASDEAASCPAQGKLPDPVISSRILPRYPPESVRSGEHGQTLLTVTIGADGNPKDVNVTGSSGSTRLDEAAVSIIKSHWRWKPFPVDCNAPSAQLAVVFGWFLDNPPKIDFGLVVSASQYPAGAADRYESGDTYLAVTLDDAGTVTDGKVVYGSGYADLDEKALAMLKNAPGIFAGKPAGEKIVMTKWNLPAPQKSQVELVVIFSRRI
jgi:TonB family protein